MQTSLSGKWNLNYRNKKVEASIPGDFHSALLEAGLIPDPYFSDNEQKILFLNKEDFSVSREFTFTKIPGCKTVLEMNYADTFFDVFINDRKAGSGKNMFVRHRFDITSLLQNGKNTIKINFYSAENQAAKEAKKLPYPVPYDKPPVFSPNRNLIRKTQCNAGWDWGPAFMVSGIYGDIFLETTRTGLFDSVRLNFTHAKKEEDQIWKIDGMLNFTSFTSKEKDFSFSVFGPDIPEIQITKKVQLQKGQNEIPFSISVKNPSVWKTSTELKEEGLEENIMYFLSISFINNHDRQSLTKQFCFNDLKCITKKEKTGGRSLYFQNNGRKIFAKGANWIPVDALPSRWTFETYYHLLKSASDANMNCIRVWGGGIYEKDCFYEICDRLGIIVWQDFMFACSLYPVTESFLANVKEEIHYQINRLQHHACIGLWCGNNENLGTLNWFQESRLNRDRYLVDYDRLYNGFIGPIVKQLDPERLWWPSSPCAGPDDYADNWHSDSKGDMHYWSVWHEKKNFSAYLDIRPRFVSEFGYESLVSLECVKTFAGEEDLNFTSPVLEYHQRSPNGNAIILDNFARYFRFPQGFENQIYLSQVQQAVAIRTAIDWWRSLEPYCMGSLVWQINDVWPGQSWSSIEYGGKWKLLHYTEKEIFEPVHVAQAVKDDIISLYIVNDFKDELECTLNIHFFDFNGNKIRKSQQIKQKVTPGNSVLAYQSPKISEDPEKGKYFVFASLDTKSNSKTKKHFHSETTAFPVLYKSCNIQKTKIDMKIEMEDGNAKITLSSEKPAFFVALDNHEIKGIFSRNCFTLLPGKTETVFFTPENKEALSELKKVLTVKNLRDTY